MTLEFAVRMPHPLRSARARRRADWHIEDTVATGLIAVSLAVLLVLLAPGALYIDDLRAQAYALDQPFWSFVTGSNQTHLAPLPRTLDWLQSRYAPLQHGPAVAITLLVRLVLGVAFWRLLRRLVGPRPAALVPLSVLLFTPALVPGTAWYRQSITAVACTAAIVWALDAHVRWAEHRRVTDLAVVAVATAVALGCYEKGVLIPVLLAGAGVALFSTRRATGRPAGALRAVSVSTAVSCVLVLGYALVYRAGPYDQGPGILPSAADVVRLGGRTLSGTTVPMLLGGPWRWSYTTPYEGVPALSAAAVTACSAMIAAATLAAIVRRPARTARALLLLGSWLAPSVLIVAYGRLDDYPWGLPAQARLWSDLVPPLLLAGTLAALPWRVGISSAADVPGSRRAAHAHRLQQHRGADGSWSVRITPASAAGALALTGVLGGSLLSTWTFAQQWWENPTDRWVASARASLRQAGPGPRVLATPIPESILPTWVARQLPTDAPLVLLLKPDARFHDGDGPAGALDRHGALVPVLPRQISGTPAAPLCATVVPAGSAVQARLPLERPAGYAEGAQIDVGMLLTRPAEVDVSVLVPGGRAVAPERWSHEAIPAGPHTLRLPAPRKRTVEAALLEVTSEADSCITFVRVWSPQR